MLLLAQPEAHSASFSNNTTHKSQFSLKLHNSKIPSTSNQTTLQQQEQVSFHLNYVGMIDFFHLIYNFLGLVFC